MASDETKGLTVLEVLENARALIADPERWTRSALARDSAGGEVHERHPNACQWCALGALAKCSECAPLFSPAIHALHVAIPGRPSIADLNDRDGHAAVLAMYDRAIAAEKAKVAQ